MEALDSLVIRSARAAAVPAGDALAMDRHVFAGLVTEAIAARPEIELVREEVTSIPRDGFAVIATGPLTSPALDRAIGELLGTRDLYFYDSMAPIVEASSLDLSKMYAMSRYGKGEGEDYWNCPLTREEYERFLDALLSGETVPIKDFEKGVYFEGCLPIEVMAERGRETLRHGPMKPMGLPDPKTGRLPWAVVQLRQDDLAREHYNIVGFQTKLEDPGAAAGLPDDPGPRERGLRALRHAPPQHLHPRARAPRPVLPDAPRAADLFRRPDHGGRGLRRERGDRPRRRPRARADPGGPRARARCPTRPPSGRSRGTARSGRPRRSSSR